MPRHRDILYLSNAGLTPCRIGPDQMDVGQPCPPTTEGFARFADHLQKHPPGRRLTLLVDLPDEAHHVELLPFTRGRDRHCMLERRRRHLFGETPFTLTHSLGRSPDGRRDEQVLFAALPRPDAITPWLEHIRQAGHVITGITSVPFLTRHLLPTDAITPTLLAHATPAGFRVTCFERGQPRFSRLTALSGAPWPPGQGWQEELRRSADYLLNQRILPRDTPTPTWLIPTQGLDLSADTDLGALHPGLAMRLDARTTATDKSEPPLHTLLRIFPHQPRLAQFAPGTVLRPYRRHLLMQTLRVLAASGSLLCAGLALYDLSAAQDLRHEEESLQAQRRTLAAQARTLHASLGTTPSDLAQQESDLSTLETLLQGEPGPEADLRQLADTLSATPGIQLTALDWHHAAAPTAGRSLEIRLAATESGPSDTRNAAPLANLLRTLRQWPNAEIRAADEREDPAQPGASGTDAGAFGQPPSPTPTIHIRWMPPK